MLSESPSKTIVLLEEIQSYMWERWLLKVKPSSKAIMLAAGCKEPCDDLHWPCVNIFTSLGHLLSSDASAHACRDATIRAAWKSFWANLGCSARRSMSANLRFSLLERCVLPVLSFRWPRWPFVRSHAKRIDRVQKAMYRSILAFKPSPGEDVGAYWRRVHRTTNVHCCERGLWSCGRRAF